MKLYRIFAFMLMLAVAFAACEKIDPPYKVVTDGGGNGSGESGDTVRNVLIEDFTGHTCVNCPSAAHKAHELINFYGQRVVVMSVHAGWFARPDAHDPLFATDFRTESGEAWNTFWSVDIQGNPNGLINRLGGAANGVINPDNWAPVVEDESQKEFLAKVTINNDYNDSNKRLSVEVEAEFQKDMEGEYWLYVGLLQDSIVAPQKDEDVEGGIDTNYVHMHTLRTSLNGIWGEVLNDGETIVEKATYDKTYTLDFEDDWVPEHCHIVAFVYYASNEGLYDDKYVIQVDQESVIPKLEE